MDKSSMENVKISVVIPAYNREALIRDTIESALDQTERIDEIIVIDNDSSDRTFQIAQSYAETHNNVKVFKNEKNVGMMENWNRGIRKTTGDYISLLHSDDIIPKNWCATVKSAIVKNKSKNIGLFFGIYACFEKKNGKQHVVSRIKNFPKDTFLKAKESLRRLWKNYYGNPNCSASIIYKREVFDVIGYFDSEKGTEADQHFHIRVLSVFNSYFIAQDLLYYRRHEFQAFDFKKEVESADTVIKRLLNAISIQKELLDSELVKYTYCGVLLYALKFLVTGKFKHVYTIFRIPGIFNLRTLVNFPRFFWMLLYRKYSGDAVSFTKKFGVHIGFAFLCFIVLRHLLFEDYDSIGHNWDWGFPALPYMFERIKELSAYAWSPVGLGRSLNLQSHVSVNEAISLIGLFFGVKKAILLILLMVFTVSFFSFKKLLDFFGKTKSTLNYLPSILYAFSPFLFNEMIGGSWYMWVSYAFAPLLFLNLIKYVHYGRVRNLLGYLISASLVMISLQNFVTLELVAVLFLVCSIFIIKKEAQSIAYQAKNYIWVHFLLVLANLYWIIPFADSLGAFYAMITDISFTGNFEGIRNITQSILHIFLMTGYLDRNMYFYSTPSYLSVSFIFSAAFFWVAALSVFLFKDRKNLDELKKNVLIWLVILTLLTLIIKGGNAPFESLTMSIFKHFPLMSLYRSPQHLMFAAAFIIPFLMSFVLHYYIARGVSKKIVAGLGLCVVLFWMSAWWYNGDLGSSILREQKKDHIDFYSISPELKRVYDDNEKNPLVHRILFLPTAFSPDFLPNAYQNKGQGGQPEYTHLKNPTFSWEFNDIAKKIDDKFCYQKDFDFMNYLSLTNTRYIFLREDIYPHHSECGIFKVWNIDTVKKAVDAIGGLTPVNEVSGLYRVNDEYFLQHIFIPNRILISDREPEQLPEVISDNYQAGTGVFLKKQNQGKDEILEELSQSYMEGGEKYESLEFKKIDPTRYIVRVQNSKGAFPLVFSESFHSGWRVYSRQMEDILTKQEFVSRNIHGTVQNDNLSSGRLWENWFREPFSRESSHLLVNGYANAWIIDPRELCSRNPESCILNEDGTYDIVVVLEFWPQRLIYFGGIISAAILFVYMLILFASRFRKNSAAKDNGEIIIST